MKSEFMEGKEDFKGSIVGNHGTSFFAFWERSDLCPAACGGDIRSKSEILKPIFDWLC